MKWDKIQTSMKGVACGLIAIALLVTLIWAARFEPVVADPDAGADVAIATASSGTTSPLRILSMRAMAVVWKKQITPPKPKPKPAVRQPVAAQTFKSTLRMKLLGVAFREDNPEAILQIEGKTQVMHIGDVVQGARLVEVGRAHVTVNQAGGDIRLQLQLPK